MRSLPGCPVCLDQQAVRTAVGSGVPRKHDGEFEDTTHSADAVYVKCSACGEFVVSDQDDVNLRSSGSRAQWNSAHLSALIREQTVRPLPRFWLQNGMGPYGPLQRTDLMAIDLDELLTRWPRSVPERIERTLCNLACLSPGGGHIYYMDARDTALAFAENQGEARFHLDALIDYKLVRMYEQQALGTKLVVTSEGWARFEKLTLGASAPENPVFVAMWFGGKEEKSKMDEAFHRAIHPAIEEAGYRATRVDLAEHNDWIMDKILGDIRIAPFVVADFTGNRNGVYLEAGFARGLRIPVIHTCREDHFKEAHFDTQQLNHVLWNTPEKLREKLYHRILGTIGQGPHSTRR